MLTCTQKSGAKEGSSSLHSSIRCPNTAVLQTISAPKSPLPGSEQTHFRAGLYCTQFYICPRAQQNHRVGVHWQFSSLSSLYHLHSPSAIPSAGHPNLTRPFKELSNDLIFFNDVKWYCKHRSKPHSVRNNTIFVTDDRNGWTYKPVKLSRLPSTC